MRSTFKVLFYVNASKEKNGIVPIMGRVTINGSVAQFSCKRTIAKELWDVKGNRAKGKSKEAREAEHKEETNILNSIINTAHRWYPDFANLLRLERLAKQIGLSAMEFAELIKGRVLNFTGRLLSSEHNRWFATDNTPLQILRAIR